VLSGTLPFWPIRSCGVARTTRWKHFGPRRLEKSRRTSNCFRYNDASHVLLHRHHVAAAGGSAAASRWRNGAKRPARPSRRALMTDNRTTALWESLPYLARTPESLAALLRPGCACRPCAGLTHTGRLIAAPECDFQRAKSPRSIRFNIDNRRCWQRSKNVRPSFSGLMRLDDEATRLDPQERGSFRSRPGQVHHCGAAG